METKCQWCGEPVFITDDVERHVMVDNIMELVTAKGVCEKCGRTTTAIKGVKLNLAENILMRSVDDCDAENAVVRVIDTQYVNVINQIREALKTELQTIVPNDLVSKGKKIILIFNGDELIKDVNTLADCIRDNYDTRDLRQWIDKEFGDITIGPSTFSSSDIIDNLGDYDDIAQEKYECDYAADRISSADLESLGDLTTEDCNLIEGQVIKVAGLSFTVGLVDKE